MSRFECDCKPPRPSVDPRRPDTCQRCLGLISPRWSSNDRNLDDFFNYLNSCQNVPITIAEFEALCERRELDGRGRFGFSYLSRDNIAEAAEEAADLLLYAYLEVLKRKREHDDIEGLDSLMMVAFYAAKAFEALAMAKRTA